MVTTIQKEGCSSSSPVPSIVHSKLTTWQLHISVILSQIDEMPQHILQSSVSTLSLSVRLWVRRSGHTLINTKQLTDPSKELKR